MSQFTNQEKEEKLLYLECYSGISGDMTVGALLDLGASRNVLEETLKSLGVGGYHLHFGRKLKCGIDAYDFDVHLEEEEHGHGHDHDHDHNHGHDHNHDHTHSHPHIHRNIQDIFEIIDRMHSEEPVKELARKMFRIVAEAESKAHGIPVEEVHFHEVGAVDSIVDIISVAVCMYDLGITDVVVSSLAEGRGYVRCQHGVIPVPVPATANIAQAYHIAMRATDNDGEMVTPTGAAIAAAYHCGEQLPKEYHICKTGIGTGNKDFKQANILRAMIIEDDTETEDKAAKSVLEAVSEAAASMWVLESNIDDCSGEALGFAMERLMKQGAADVWYTPAFMKKNRPAYVLHVLCSEDKIPLMEDEIFASTTTIGIRRYSVERTILERRKEIVATGYGEAEVKVCTHKDKKFCYPEYESVKNICENQGLSYEEAYYLVRTEAEKKYK